MSAPSPRATREQVDRALVIGANRVGPPSATADAAAVLAAEVRAQRVELEAARSFIAVLVAERDQLRAALAARTPQPAEPPAPAGTPWRVIPEGRPPEWKDDGYAVVTADWSETTDRAEHYVAERMARETAELLVAAANVVPQPAVPDGPESTGAERWADEFAPYLAGALRDPEFGREYVASAIDYALFGAEDGDLLDDEANLPVGELRRLIREEAIPALRTLLPAVPDGEDAETEPCAVCTSGGRLPTAAELLDHTADCAGAEEGQQ